jgi:hypothetical protein
VDVNDKAKQLASFELKKYSRWFSVKSAHEAGKLLVWK